MAPWHTERISGPLADGVDKRARLASRGSCTDRSGEHSLTMGGQPWRGQDADILRIPLLVKFEGEPFLRHTYRSSAVQVLVHLVGGC